MTPLTRESISTMEAGREMDALVADFMDWQPADGSTPYYSTEIAAAWEVVEQLDKLKYWPYIKKPAPSMGDLKHWSVRFYPKDSTDLQRVAESKCKSITLAICRAALLTTLTE